MIHMETCLQRHTQVYRHTYRDMFEDSSNITCCRILSKESSARMDASHAGSSHKVICATLCISQLINQLRRIMRCTSCMRYTSYMRTRRLSVTVCIAPLYFHCYNSRHHTHMLFSNHLHLCSPNNMCTLLTLPTERLCCNCTSWTKIQRKTCQRDKLHRITGLRQADCHTPRHCSPYTLWNQLQRQSRLGNLYKNVLHCLHSFQMHMLCMHRQVTVCHRCECREKLSAIQKGVE